MGAGALLPTKNLLLLYKIDPLFNSFLLFPRDLFRPALKLALAGRTCRQDASFAMLPETLAAVLSCLDHACIHGGAKQIALAKLTGAWHSCSAAPGPAATAESLLVRLAQQKVGLMSFYVVQALHKSECPTPLTPSVHLHPRAPRRVYS